LHEVLEFLIKLMYFNFETRNS